MLRSRSPSDDSDPPHDAIATSEPAINNASNGLRTRRICKVSVDTSSPLFESIFTLQEHLEHVPSVTEPPFKVRCQYCRMQ
jgi:hypothetical protein